MEQRDSPILRRLWAWQISRNLDPSYIPYAEMFDPQSSLALLDKYAQRLYKKKFLDLSPRAQVVVAVAAFHPGARYLEERYPIEILKSDIVLKWLLRAREDVGQLLPREYQIGKVKVKTTDLMRAANIGGIGMTEEAARFLEGLGLKALPAEGFFHGLASATLGHTPEFRWDIVSIPTPEGKEVRVFFPRSVPSIPEHAGTMAGQLLADLPFMLTASALGRLLTLRAPILKKLPDWAHHQLEAHIYSPAIGAVRASQRGEKPEKMVQRMLSEIGLRAVDPTMAGTPLSPAWSWAGLLFATHRKELEMSWEEFKEKVREVLKYLKRQQSRQQQPTPTPKTSGFTR